MLSSNQVLNQGRYRIIEHFGNVDSGRLYEAYDTVNNAKVVLRETVGQLGRVATAAQIENIKTAFAEDAKRLAGVDHPSLLKVNDFFSEIDRQYLVMESCDGSDLGTLISSQEKSPGMTDIMRWADQILDGLHFLHSQKPSIIHQNVSPQNSRLTSNFTVKLFITGGSGGSTSEPDTDASLDGSGQAYKSLEQLWHDLDSASQKMIANSFGEKSEEILRQPADARSDVYSAAATIYFLLTKTEPVDALARYLEVLDGSDDPLQSPIELNSSVPTEISDAIMKAMALKREERFESAASMRAQLAKAKLPSRLADVRIRATTNVETPEVPQDTRVEQESLNVEKARIELEAAQKRLEEEKALVAKRRSELEAEKQRQAQLLEAKRLEDERQKADRLRADKAAEEKIRAQKLEEARKQAEAAKTNTQPSQGRPETQKPQLDLAKNDLLDLPEPAIEISVEPDVLALDAERENAARSTDIDTSFDIYPHASSSRGMLSRGPILAAAAAIAVIAVIGVWMFAGSGHSSAPPPAASFQTDSAGSEDKLPSQSVDTPAADSNSSLGSQTGPQPTVETDPSAGTESKVEQDAKLKPHKQPTPQAKPTPEKKKVTVDDLINDN